MPAGSDGPGLRAGAAIGLGEFAFDLAAQALFQDQVADIGTHCEHHVSRQRSQGDQVEQGVLWKILDEIMKAALLHVDQARTHIGPQEGGQRGRQALGQVFVDQFNGAHLFLRKAGWRPEVIGLDGFLVFSLGMLARMVHQFGQVDSIPAVFLIHFKRAGKQRVDF